MAHDVEAQLEAPRVALDALGLGEVVGLPPGARAAADGACGADQLREVQDGLAYLQVALEEVGAGRSNIASLSGLAASRWLLQVRASRRNRSRTFERFFFRA